MKSSDVKPHELIDLLFVASPSLPIAQEFMSKKVEGRVPRSSYDAIWASITRPNKCTNVEAAHLVFDLTMAYASERLVELVKEFQADGQVAIDPDETGPGPVLFFNNGFPRKLGEHFLAYWEEHKPGKAAPTTRPAMRSKAVPEGLLNAMSSEPGIGMSLQRINTSKYAILEVDPNWSEDEIETYFMENWSKIDFGLGERLLLRDRQSAAPNAPARMDMVAQGESGDWYVIELKKKEAKMGDYGQLRLYMNLLRRDKGGSEESIKGVLIAPSFSWKVLEASSHEKTAVSLLRFKSEGEEEDEE